MNPLFQRKKEYALGQIAGLRLTAAPSAASGTLLIWLLLSAVGYGLLDLPLGTAAWGGLIAALLHRLASLIHNLGHAWAARRAGYPMRDARFGLLLAAARYPKDEPKLPAVVHIRRALGGPVLSFLVALATAGWLLIGRPAAGVGAWLVWFFFLDNLLVYTLGALLPLGFTDGSTILYWRQRRGGD